MKIRLTESNLKQIVVESVKRVLIESDIDDYYAMDDEYMKNPKNEFIEICDNFNNLEEVMRILMKYANEEDFYKWNKWLSEELDILRR